MSEKTKSIYKEKKRGEKLLTKLLPNMIANQLKEEKVKIKKRRELNEKSRNGTWSIKLHSLFRVHKPNIK